LITLLRQKLIAPSCLIDIKGVAELDYLRYDDKKGLAMGPLTTHRTIERSPIIQKNYPVLSDMEKSVASVQTRNWGTIGGNLCSADPIGDAAPTLLALGAQVKMKSVRGERMLPLGDFFTDYFTTVLEPDEILAEVQLPAPAAQTGVVYMKFSTIEAGIKIVSASVLITLDASKKTCKDARIVMSAVAPIPFIAKKAEAAELAAAETSPIADVHASAEYRREIAKVISRRATKEAFERAKAA